MPQVYRHEIPVDDRWHPLQFAGPVLHVACRNVNTVEVWAMNTPGPKPTRSFRVYGTGQSLPPDLHYVGTALAPGGGLVWHLFETD